MESKTLIAASLALAFTCSGLFGQVTWIGLNATWSAGSNWSTGVVPTGATNIEFGNYNGTAPVTGNTNQPANDVSFTRTSGTIILGLSSGGGLNAGGTISSAVGASEVFLRNVGRLAGANLTVNNALNLGSRSASGASAQIGNVTISGTTSIGSAGTLHAAGLNGTTNLGSLEMVAGSTFNLVAGNSNPNGTGDGATNNITVSRLNGAGTIAGGKTNATLTTTGHLTINGSANGTFSGNITNGLANNVVQISKAGSGTLTLSGANTYTGATTINAGTLQIGSGGTTGNLSTSSAITNNGTLSFSRNNTITQGTNFGSVIAGTGNLIQAGTGNLVLTGANTYSGGTALSAGTIQIGHASALGASGNITFSGGTLQYGSGITTDLSARIKNSAAAVLIDTNTNTVTFASAIDSTNTLGLTKNGAGTLILNSANTYTGATTINAGNLTTSNANVISDSSAVTVSSGAQFAIGGAETVGSIAGAGNYSLESFTLTAGGDNTNTTVSGIISGSGGLTKAGTGTLTLSGANTYTGSTTVNAGNLTTSNANVISDSSAVTVSSGAQFAIGGAETVGSIAGAGNYSLGSFTLTAGGDNTNTAVSGIISGSGGLTKAGTGTLTLSGANTYTNSTTINAGTLVVNNTNTSSAITINTGGTLAGTGSGGATTVNSGGRISPGDSSIGTLSTSTLTLNGGGGYTFNISNVAGSAGTNWDLINVGGGSGEVTINSSLGSPFTIFLTDTPTGWLDSGTYAWNIISSNNVTGFAADKFAFNLSEFNGGVPPSGAFFMTNSGSALVLNYTILGDSIWSGGSGNWDTGFSPAVTTNANVVFTGAGGNATNNIASATLNTLQTISFNSTAGSYTLEANSASAGHSATPLELTGSIINNSTSAQTLNLAMTFNAGRMVDTASGNITIGGVINGSGGLTKNGSGTLALTANNTFTGGVQVNAGTLATTDSGGFANSANITVASGATYNVGVTDQINSLNASGSLVLSSGTLTISSSSTNSIVSGAISGGGILTKSGSGTLTISNNNTGYSGQTFHSGGVIEIGHNGALGTGNFLLRNNGATIQSTDATDRTIANRFGTFTGANATYIFGSAGTGNLTFSNTQTSSLGDNRTFTISNSVTRFDGIFTGSGFGITKGGTGLMILAGNNTYSGATTINAGTLQISSTGLLGGGIYSGNISNSGTFLFASNSNQTIAGIISGAGAITKNGTSTLTLSGNNSYSGGTTISAGTLQITSTGLLGGGSYSGNIANSGFLIAGSNSNQILSGIISGTGALTKNGSGTLTLSGSNTYSGGTTISAGTLQITSTGLLGGGSYSGNIVNSGALIAGSNSNQILSGIISGAGALTKNGSGTLALSESNSYSGGTTLNTGTLVIGNAAAAGSGTISQSSGSSLLKIDTTGTIANNMSVFNVLASQSATLSGAITVNNATWDIDTGDTLTISGTVSGNGGVNKNGSGTLILSGSNTYVGATTVNAGTLNAAHANALGSNTTVQVNGGSLLVTADDAINGKNITLASTAAGSAAAAGLSFNGTYNGTAGSLTLSENSTIDLGTGSVAVHFSDLAMGLYKLAIYNWTGTTLWGGGNGNNTDQIYFDTTLDTNELNRISFYSDLTSSSFLGTAFQLSGGSFNQEIIPVPEPETYAVAVILLLGFGIYALRRSPRAQDPV